VPKKKGLPRRKNRKNIETHCWIETSHPVSRTHIVNVKGEKFSLEGVRGKEGGPWGSEEDDPKRHTKATGVVSTSIAFGHSPHQTSEVRAVLRGRGEGNQGTDRHWQRHVGLSLANDFLASGVALGDVGLVGRELLLCSGC